jgi:hypothetical protein
VARHERVDSVSSVCSVHDYEVSDQNFLHASHLVTAYWTDRGRVIYAASQGFRCVNNPCMTNDDPLPGKAP